MGVDSSHVLQQIVIEEHGSSPNGKGVIEVPSPASVFRPDNMSDTWSRSSSQPTDESASSSTPGNPLYSHPLSSSNALSVSGSPIYKASDFKCRQGHSLEDSPDWTLFSMCTDHLCISSFLVVLYVSPLW